MSSDALLVLDPDQEHALMSNGTQSKNDSREASRDPPQVPGAMARSRETPENQLRTSTDDLHPEPVVCPQKKVIKPPMPPTKEPKPSGPEVEAEKETCPTKKVCKIFLNTLIYSSVSGDKRLHFIMGLWHRKLLELRADGVLWGC